jgi:Anaphase-promoting complex APC subunit CDC26
MSLRRPPTRIELKPDDAEEYEQVRCRALMQRMCSSQHVLRNRILSASAQRLSALTPHCLIASSLLPRFHCCIFVRCSAASERENDVGLRPKQRQRSGLQRPASGDVLHQCDDPENRRRTHWSAGAVRSDSLKGTTSVLSRFGELQDLYSCIGPATMERCQTKSLSPMTKAVDLQDVRILRVSTVVVIKL